MSTVDTECVVVGGDGSHAAEFGSRRGNCDYRYARRGPLRDADTHAITPLERAGWCWFRLYDERARFRQRLTLLERGRSVGDHAEYLSEVIGLLDIYLADLSRLLAHQTRDHPFQSVLRPVLRAPVADAFCAVIGDLTRFPTKRHLIAYLGLAPNRARHPTLNRIYYLHASCLVNRRGTTDTRWVQAYQRARARGLHYMASIRCAWRALFLEAWKKSRSQPSLRAIHATLGDET